MTSQAPCWAPCSSPAYPSPVLPGTRCVSSGDCKLVGPPQVPLPPPDPRLRAGPEVQRAPWAVVCGHPRLGRVHLQRAPPSFRDRRLQVCHGEGRGWRKLAWGAGSTGSVVLEEKEKVLAAVRGQIRWAQVGQQLIGVGQLLQQVQGWLWGLPCPRHRGPITPAAAPKASSPTGPQLTGPRGCRDARGGVGWCNWEPWGPPRLGVCSPSGPGLWGGSR